MQSRTVIAVDAREASHERRTGKGQWARGFLTELMGRDVRVRLYTDAASVTDWAPGADIRGIARTGLGWHLAAARDLRMSEDTRLFLSPTSYIIPALLGNHASPACIPVVHDLIAFRGEPHDRKAQLIERLTLGRALRNAAHVLAISESTKADLLARFPALHAARVTPVFAGPMRESAPLSRPDGRTILCIATLCPRKNQLRLLQAYALLSQDLRARHRLLLAGARGWNDDEIVALVARTPGAEWLGHVPDDEYERLLSSCTVFALPSLYEGFGMQILDALQRGIPVLTSNRGSLPEVTGTAAVSVDPESVESIAEGLRQVLQDEGLRERLRTAGPAAAQRFTWKRTVDTALAAILPS